LRETVLKMLRMATLVLLSFSLALLLASCYLFVGTPTELVPLPSTVVVQDPPQILSCTATMIDKTCEDRYERICGWYFWTEPAVQTPSTGWIYTCRNVWHATDCLYDITIRLVVHDPSGDLDSNKFARVRVFDSEPTSRGISGQDCLLDVPQTDIVIQSSGVEGSGLTKTISVRLKDVMARFTDNCGAFSATLRFAIVFDVDGEELSSANTRAADVECDRPYTTPIYLYSSPPNMLALINLIPGVVAR
jgi:hypothetical protein